MTVDTLRRCSEKQEKRYKKRSIKKSDIVLSCSIIAVIAYTIAAIFLQWHSGAEVSPTLTERWYSFWTVEIVALSGIKAVNVLKGENDGNSETDSGIY